MNRLLTAPSPRMAAANRYAKQLKLARPERPWRDCLSQALRETCQTNRFWKRTRAGQVVTAQALRAIRDNQADMRPKAQDIEVGDLLTTFGNL